MAKIELQILQETLDFMSENCIGPQSSIFLYNLLKSKLKHISSFSYSYFLSLFNNKNMITVQMVKEKITQYIDIADDYYYCTKTTRIPKYKILETLHRHFEDNGYLKLNIKDCYKILQEEFNIYCFNMANLKEFLQTDKIVSKQVVEKLMIENTPVDEEKNRIINLKQCLIGNREKWIKLIKCVGIEFIDYLSKNGLKPFIQFNNLMSEFEPSSFSKLELVNPQNDKVLREEDYNILFGFIKLFTEDEFLKILNDEHYLSQKIDTYLDDIKKKQELPIFLKKLKTSLNDINKDNRRAKIKYILPFEVSTVLSNYDTLEDLIKEDEDKLTFLYDYYQDILNCIVHMQQSIPALLSKKFEHLLQRVNASNKPNSKWEKYVEVLLLRAQGNTFESIGKTYGHTKEGVRIIEEKYNKLFASFYNSPNGTLTRLIRAFVKNEWYMTIDDVSSVFSFYPELFYYLLKKEQCDDIEYVEDLDIYYFIDDIDWYKEILSIIDRIEGVLNQEQFNTTIQECDKYLESLGIKIPYEIIEKALKLEFRQNGTMYSRNKMNLSSKYKQILAKAFPNGIRVYEKEDLDAFRQEYAKTFNDNQIPDNDRALNGRIIACCYLIGKGKYALKKDKYISEELATKIYNYIQESPRDIFLTNMLFATFENELKSEGIDNKYHLQGVLKELFYNKLYFSRDYISKSGQATSIYNDIYNYVKQAEGEVTIEQIMNEFKNVPYTVVATGLSNENILKFSGSYIHADKLNIDKADGELFALAIDEILLGNDYSNTYILYDYLLQHNKALLDKYKIEGQFQLFSIIQYLLQEQYEFRRPYFANKGVEIGYIRERIISYIKDSKEVTFAELKNEFPEFLDSILYNTLSGDEIICCRKSYMHADNLNMSADDIELLKSVIVNLCSDNDSHSAHELLMILDLKYSSIVNKYNIDNQFKLFSIIKFLFADEFEFS
ncbi:MAG: hypothetical protein IKY15_01385, partial [Clostridia bacterium]|nr:hypothetical protein [Clostridia bacterium]